MIKAYTTREEITELGREHAEEAIRDSGCTETPDGGWDSWLIDGIGCDATWRLFGEGESSNADEWTDSMKEKLQWYHEGAVEVAERIEADSKEA